MADGISYDESDDTREKAGTVRLEKALPVKR